ncbi:DUF4129 domain-containing protein [Gryllotalpicola ginsengisoli]|uniref:DUF4129 domain-containing protein n=1 Tax=Gryllotalpicola ginsengisoli TaxID=444608 RepID=UPI0003B3C393|nr:DUF4129 domain-containing protein [Gryllotalpicola ginsengisoli]
MPDFAQSSVPNPLSGQSETAEPNPLPAASGHQGSLVEQLLIAAAAVAAAFLIWWVLRGLARRRGRRIGLPQLGEVSAAEGLGWQVSGTEPEAEPDAPTVARGLRRALDLLEEQREPADAVVAAWLGLQQAAEESGVERRPAETPTEFTERVIARVRADRDAAGRLVDVYQAVRFGGRAVTPADVEAARGAIRALLDSWHEPAVGRRR